MSDQTLFQSIDVFEIGYVPELFNYRESQLKRPCLPDPSRTRRRAGALRHLQGSARDREDDQHPPDLCGTRTDHKGYPVDLRQLPERPDEIHGLLLDLRSGLRARSGADRDLDKVGDGHDRRRPAAAGDKPDRLSGRCKPAPLHQPARRCRQLPVPGPRSLRR